MEAAIFSGRTTLSFGAASTLPTISAPGMSAKRVAGEAPLSPAQEIRAPHRPWASASILPSLPTPLHLQHGTTVSRPALSSALTLSCTGRGSSRSSALQPYAPSIVSSCPSMAAPITPPMTSSSSSFLIGSTGRLHAVPNRLPAARPPPLGLPSSSFVCAAMAAGVRLTKEKKVLVDNTSGGSHRELGVRLARELARAGQRVALLSEDPGPELQELEQLGVWCIASSMAAGDVAARGRFDMIYHNESGRLRSSLFRPSAAVTMITQHSASGQPPQVPRIASGQLRRVQHPRPQQSVPNEANPLKLMATAAATVTAPALAPALAAETGLGEGDDWEGAVLSEADVIEPPVVIVDGAGPAAVGATDIPIGGSGEVARFPIGERYASDPFSELASSAFGSGSVLTPSMGDGQGVSEVAEPIQTYTGPDDDFSFADSPPSEALFPPEVETAAGSIMPGVTYESFPPQKYETIPQQMYEPFPAQAAEAMIEPEMTPGEVWREALQGRMADLASAQIDDEETHADGMGGSWATGGGIVGRTKQEGVGRVDEGVVGGSGPVPATITGAEVVPNSPTEAPAPVSGFGPPGLDVDSAATDVAATQSAAAVPPVVSDSLIPVHANAPTVDALAVDTVVPSARAALPDPVVTIDPLPDRAVSDALLPDPVVSAADALFPGSGSPVGASSGEISTSPQLTPDLTPQGVANAPSVLSAPTDSLLTPGTTAAQPTLALPENVAVSAGGTIGGGWEDGAAVGTGWYDIVPSVHGSISEPAAGSVVGADGVTMESFSGTVSGVVEGVVRSGSDPSGVGMERGMADSVARVAAEAGKGFTGAASGVGKGINLAAAGLQNVAATVMESLSEAEAAAQSAVTGTVSRMMGTVKGTESAVGATVDGARAAVEGTKAAVDEARAAVVGVGMSAASAGQQVVTAASGSVEGAVRQVTHIPDEVKDGAAVAAKGLAVYSARVNKEMLDVATEAVAETGRTFSGPAGAVGSVVEGVAGSVVGVVSAAGDVTVSKARAVGTPIQGVLNQVSTAVGQGTVQLQQDVAAAEAALPAGVREQVRPLKETLAGAGDRAAEALQQVGDALTQVERSVGIDPNDPALTAAIVLGSPLLLGAGFLWSQYFGGYAGDLTAEQVWNALNNGEDVVLVDIRPSTIREIEGMLDLPTGLLHRLVLVDPIQLQDHLYQYADVADTEKFLTGCLITRLAALKKRTKVVIMDSGTQRMAKDVARVVYSQGFKHSFRLKGGFPSWRQILPTTASIEDMTPVEMPALERGGSDLDLLLLLSAFVLGTAAVGGEFTLEGIGAVSIGQAMYKKLASYQDLDDLQADIRSKVPKNITDLLRNIRSGLPGTNRFPSVPRAFTSGPSSSGPVPAERATRDQSKSDATAAAIMALEEAAGAGPLDVDEALEVPANVPTKTTEFSKSP